jgi:RNA polymerase sigma factor (sigma-70 family)
MSHDDHSTQIQDCIDRLRSGEASARDDLLAHALDRMTRLTRKMLRDFPEVHRWEQTDDVIQNAAVRLCRALEEVKPATVAEFFGLAAAQIRRELLDLARRYSGAHGRAARHDVVYPAAGDVGNSSNAPPQPSDTTHDPDRLAAWTEFHSQVERLPAEEREAFDLVYYQGLSHAEVAAVVGVSERTSKRRWQAARLRVSDAMEGRLPGL